MALQKKVVKKSNGILRDKFVKNCVYKTLRLRRGKTQKAEVDTHLYRMYVKTKRFCFHIDMEKVK